MVDEIDVNADNRSRKLYKRKERAENKFFENSPLFIKVSDVNHPVVGEEQCHHKGSDDHSPYLSMNTPRSGD